MVRLHLNADLLIRANPLNEDFGQRMQKIFNNHNLTFDLSYFRAWVANAVNEPDLGMERVVNQLKEDGIKVGLLTNSVPEFWPVIERTINTKLFDCIVDSSTKLMDQLLDYK